MRVNVSLICAAFSAVALGGCAETDYGTWPVEEDAGQPCSLFGAGRDPIKGDLLDVFPPCCEGDGRLVPPNQVPESFRDIFAQDERGAICVPVAIASDPQYMPPPCTMEFWGEGACMTTCIPLVADLYGGNPQADCPPRHVCIPYANYLLDFAEQMVCGGEGADGGAGAADGA